MDLVTQGCLGGMVGELTLGRTLGARAAAWGVGLGLLPDADALLKPLLDDLQEVTWHRSLTHSLVFCLLAPPVLAWGLQRRYPDTDLRRWLVLVFATLSTHVMLDCCTTWGTQVLWPFDVPPVALCSVSVVDPLVTVPLLLGLVGSLFLPRESKRRAGVAWAGLLLSLAYLGSLFGVKAHVEAVLAETLAKEQVVAQRTLTKPTMGDGFLWRAVAETEDEYWIGYYSLLDSDRRVEGVRRIPKNRQLLAEFADDEGVERLQQALGMYCSVARVDSQVVVRDVRYGQWKGWEQQPSPYVFQYHLSHGDGRTEVRVAPRIKAGPELRRSFMARIRGR